MRRTTLIVLGLALLSSCGWHLQGTLPGSSSLTSIYIEDRVRLDQTADQPFIDQLHKDLQQLNVESLKQPDATNLQLVIIGDRLVDRALTLDRNLFGRQVELEKEVVFEIRSADEKLLLSDRLLASIDLTEDPTRPAAKAEERRQFEHQLNREISRQLLHILRVQKQAQAASLSQTD